MGVLRSFIRTPAITSTVTAVLLVSAGLLIILHLKPALYSSNFTLGPHTIALFILYTLAIAFLFSSFATGTLIAPRILAVVVLYLALCLPREPRTIMSSPDTVTTWRA